MQLNHLFDLDLRNYDALQNWTNRLSFTSCDYREGQLFMHVPDKVEPEYVAYMQQMKLHLDKAYPGLLPTPTEIESEHKKTCDMIKKVLSSTSIVPSKPSYERIIVDKIGAYCPALKRSQDAHLRENNIYLDTFIFRILFDIALRQGPTMTLDVEPQSKSDMKQLYYEHGTIIGQGEPTLMTNLKQALGELLRDKSIKDRIEEYVEIRTKLQNDPQIERLRSIATVMRDRMYGHSGGLSRV